MTESAITNRKLRKAVHPRNLDRMRDYVANQLPYLNGMGNTPPVVTITTEDKIETPVTVKAPKRTSKPKPMASAEVATKATVGTKTRRTGVVIIRKIWGTVVFGLDAIADLFAGAGKVVAFYLTPEIWAAANVVLAVGRGMSHTWTFFRPSSEASASMLYFCRPLSLLEVYAETLTMIMPIALLPSWMFQKIDPGLQLGHDVRKAEYADQMLKADPMNYWAARYRERLAAQYMIRNDEKATEKTAVIPTITDVKVPAMVKGETAEMRAEVMENAGWHQVRPVVAVTQNDLVALQAKSDDFYAAFPNLHNVDGMHMDQFGRYWAKAEAGKHLFTMEEEMRRAMGEDKPKTTTASTSNTTGIPVQRNGKPLLTDEQSKLLSKLDKESAKWEREKKDAKRRSLLYGQHVAATAVMENPRVLTNKRAHDKVRDALLAEVRPLRSGFFTERARTGFDRAIKQLKLAAEQQQTQAA